MCGSNQGSFFAPTQGSLYFEKQLLKKVSSERIEVEKNCQFSAFNGPVCTCLQQLVIQLENCFPNFSWPENIATEKSERSTIFVNMNKTKSQGDVIQN